MKAFILLVLALVLFACTQKEVKIYQWRGQDRAGIYYEEGLQKEWIEDGPEEVWSTELLGHGYGSPVITEDKLYVTGTADSMAMLFCLDLQGQLVWESAYGEEWMRNFPGSRSAPTVVGELIYVGSGMGNLYCFDLEGNVVWSKSFEEDFKGVYPRFGIAEAALVDDDKVFWCPGGEEHNIVALNRFTGKLIWSCKAEGERPGYNSPNLIALPGKKIMVTFTAYHLLGIDVKTGEVLWKHAQDNTPVEKRQPGAGDTHSNTAVYDNGAIYYAAGDGNRGVKLELSEDGTSIKEIWRSEGFDSYMGGIVKIGDYVYGGGVRKKALKRVNASDGQMADTLKIGDGIVIAADGLLYYYNQKGVVNLVDYSGDDLKVVSTFKVEKGSKEHFSHPVIDNGVLYIRRGKALMAYDIKETV